MMANGSQFANIFPCCIVELRTLYCKCLIWLRIFVKVITNCCYGDILQEDPTLINDIREDITGESEKFGPVKKCVIYDVSGTLP